MAVFRVERTNNYTVMSNYHLRDKTLSLKAKGLLSLMLSLPETWDYTLAGLARISLEGKDAIRAAVVELEKAGYIHRSQTTDKTGKFSSNEYIIREYPAFHEPSSEGPSPAQPLPENPTTDHPSTDSTQTEKPTQLNKDPVRKEKANTDSVSTDCQCVVIVNGGLHRITHTAPMHRRHPVAGHGAGTNIDEACGFALAQLLDGLQHAQGGTVVDPKSLLWNIVTARRDKRAGMQNNIRIFNTLAKLFIILQIAPNDLDLLRIRGQLFAVLLGISDQDPQMDLIQIFCKLLQGRKSHIPGSAC